MTPGTQLPESGTELPQGSLGMGEKFTPGLAQFFFECGYGACYADAFAYLKVGPWKLTDELIEQSFRISQEVYEDAAEYDRYRALADAAPDLYSALAAAMAIIRDLERNCIATISGLSETQEQIDAALAKARGEAA